MSRATAATAVTTLAACLLAPGQATAAELPGAANLSPRLSTLSRPSVRSAPPAEQARKLGLVPEGPGSLLRRGNRVLVYVRFDRGAVAGLPALRRAGAQVVDASRRYQTVTVAAKPADLRPIGKLANVAGVMEAHAPFTAASCPSGEVVSAGVHQLNAGEGAEEARSAFGVDGSGVTVGLLSDSFDQATEAVSGGKVATHAADDVASADLPGAGNPCGHTSPVDVLEEDEISPEEDADEGRAMAQIVHDVAPGAGIAFASAFNGELSFASNIETLAEEGANVIADDVFYFEEPFFQDGPVAVAVAEAVAGGATYLSAAGNDNLFDSEKNEIASWETPSYRDSGGCPSEVQALPFFNGSHCLDFDPGAGVDRTFGIKVKPGRVLNVDLQWSEPWNGVETDLDAFLLDAEGHLIEAEFADNVFETQEPTEILQWPNESGATQTVQLVVNRYSGLSPRVKFALIENGSGVTATEYPSSSGEDVVGPTIFGHSGSAAAISVGAINVNQVGDPSPEPEPYSSRGPVRHDFGPVVDSKAAKPLPEPEILSKPDVVASDCGATTFFASFVKAENAWRFCGTSAAAPHAAGVAALMLDSKPGATPGDVRTGLQESASPIGEFGPCAVGAGLVDAVKAIEALPASGAYSPPECSVPSPEASEEEPEEEGEEEEPGEEEPEEPGEEGEEEWGSETPPSRPLSPTTATVSPTAATGERATEASRPHTFIRRHPPHLIRTRHRRARAVFRFGSDDPDASFVCRIDSGPFRRCPRRFARRFRVGRHALRVAACDAAGNRDPTPAVWRFRVKRIR